MIGERWATRGKRHSPKQAVNLLQKVEVSVVDESFFIVA